MKILVCNTNINSFFLHLFSAERRAQLSRSRSRQNLLSDTSTMCEINFDESNVDTPPREKVAPPRSRERRERDRNREYDRERNGGGDRERQRNNSNSVQNDEETDAEKLLARLKAL